MSDTKIKMPDVRLTVFGTRPKDQIFLPAIGPFSVRADCKSGQFKIGEDNFIGKELDMSIIKIARFVGNLGKTRAERWLQIFFIPGESSKLPKNTVCVTYIKKRSITQFAQAVTAAMENGEPALGVFKGILSKHASDLGDYYSVEFCWRDRKSEPEMHQLEMIADFLATEPELIDIDRTSNMTSVEGMSQEEIQLIVESYRELAALPQASQ